MRFIIILLATIPFSLIAQKHLGLINDNRGYQDTCKNNIALVKPPPISGPKAIHLTYKLDIDDDRQIADIPYEIKQKGQIIHYEGADDVSIILNHLYKHPDYINNVLIELVQSEPTDPTIPHTEYYIEDFYLCPIISPNKPNYLIHILVNTDPNTGYKSVFRDISKDRKLVKKFKFDKREIMDLSYKKLTIGFDNDTYIKLSNGMENLKSTSENRICRVLFTN